MALFDRNAARSSTRLGCRPETGDDAAFVQKLAHRCSPLVGLVPETVLQQQLTSREAGLAREFPDAMRRILIRANERVGRLIVDWRGSSSWCVDIAVAPEAANRGIGSAALQCWIDTADAVRLPTALMVLRTNRAAQLYARLGFEEVADDDADPVYATLRRSVGGILAKR